VCLERLFEELTCGVRVANRGGVADVEDGGEVEGVSAVCEGLVELSVDPESLEGGGQSP
jgi:hypothetical protein